MRWRLWTLIAILAAGGGALLARYRQPLDEPTIQSAEADTTPVASSSIQEPTDVTSSSNDQPAPTPEPVTMPAFQAIVYKPKAGEQAAVASIGVFYDAYNKGDLAKTAAQFDLSVPVTAAITAAIQPGVPRPVAVTIKTIVTSTDGFQTVILDEVRSDDKTYARIIELEPASGGMLLTAYRATETGGETSGF